jgi:hypothetical protein
VPCGIYTEVFKDARNCALEDLDVVVRVMKRPVGLEPAPVVEQTFVNVPLRVSVNGRGNHA